MAAADNGVHRDTLADACRRYLLADGVDDAIEFMADDAGIFRERVVAVIDVYIGTTDPGKSNFHPYYGRPELEPDVIQCSVGLAL